MDAKVISFHQNSYKKSFELTKKRHIPRFDKLISKNKIKYSVTNIKSKEMGY